MGLDEFSMSATQILKARKMVNGLSKDEAAKLADEALKLATAEEVLDLVKKAVD